MGKIYVINEENDNIVQILSSKINNKKIAVRVLTLNLAGNMKIEKKNVPTTESGEDVCTQVDQKC